MGFEDVVPPLPSRDQEIRFIQRNENSFIAQPFYKLYMNEALRQKKMQVGEEVNARRSDYFRNFSIGFAIASVVVYHPIIHFYQREQGTPYIYKPKAAILETGYLQNRNRKMLSSWIFLSAAFALMYAHRYSRNFMSDEYMVNKAVIIESYD